MKLASYEIQTALGRFERIGALACGTLVDLNSACTAWLAESHDANAARRHADAVVPPDMIGFLEAGSAARRLADGAVAYVAERLKTESNPLGPQGQRLNFAESEIRWLAPVPKPPMIRDGILLLDHYRVGMERLFKIAERERMPEAARTMPIYWKPSRAAVAGHREPIRWPKYSDKLDYELSGPPAFSVGFELDRWIKPGDIVQCEIEGVGILSNPIVRA